MSESTASAPPSGRISMVARFAAALAVAAVLVAGVFVLGRVADDAGVAMALTGLWFGLVLLGGYLFTRARAPLRLPMAGAFALVALMTGLLVGLPSIRDQEVDEDVVVAEPPPPPGSAAGGRGRTQGPEQRNVRVASGRFSSIEHPGRGDVAVVELAEGGRRLTLTSFETDSGPDLRVYLSTGDPARGDLGDYEDLGGLKGNKGNQQYEIPEDLDLAKYSTVMIWCRAFSVPFTSARLKS